MPISQHEKLAIRKMERIIDQQRAALLEIKTETLRRIAWHNEVGVNKENSYVRSEWIMNVVERGLAPIKHLKSTKTIKTATRPKGKDGGNSI
jgi:hypothetical protein